MVQVSMVRKSDGTMYKVTSERAERDVCRAGKRAMCRCRVNNRKVLGPGCESRDPGAIVGQVAPAWHQLADRVVPYREAARKFRKRSRCYTGAVSTVGRSRLASGLCKKRAGSRGSAWGARVSPRVRVRVRALSVSGSSMSARRHAHGLVRVCTCMRAGCLLCLPRARLYYRLRGEFARDLRLFCQPSLALHSLLSFASSVLSLARRVPRLFGSLRFSFLFFRGISRASLPHRHPSPSAPCNDAHRCPCRLEYRRLGNTEPLIRPFPASTPAAIKKPPVFPSSSNLLNHNSLLLARFHRAR
ncbi:uncharacterized protein LOC143211881 isoform X1 [Lasioglossum baleicum]|uniref:uncharacterized protein LOC143211881 isoform X1 n=1 Tax=Lasioglossum baleicum TaxID=434251 RepID=UPI003FCC594D